MQLRDLFDVGVDDRPAVACARILQDVDLHPTTVPTLVASDGSGERDANGSHRPGGPPGDVADDGAPHLVPGGVRRRPGVDHDRVYTAVDGKPKSTQLLKRLANIAATPRGVPARRPLRRRLGAIVVGARRRRRFGVHGGPDADTGRALLRAKYAQYQSVPLDGPVIAVTVQRWTAWHP